MTEIERQSREESDYITVCPHCKSLNDIRDMTLRRLMEQEFECRFCHYVWADSFTVASRRLGMRIIVDNTA